MPGRVIAALFTSAIFVVSCSTPTSPLTPLPGTGVAPAAIPPAVASSLGSVPGAATVAPPEAPPPRKKVHAELVYEGALAGQEIVMRLRCDAPAPCTGYYFYRQFGESLRLTQEGEKRSSFREANARETPTGSFELSDPPGAARLGGTWTSADGLRKLSLDLRIIDRTSKARAFVRKMREHAADDPRCQEEVQSFELVGVDDPAIEQAVNDFFDIERMGVLINPTAYEGEWDGCTEAGNRCLVGANGRRIRCPAPGASTVYQARLVREVAYLDEDLLSVTLRDDGWTGGIHPFFSIAGMNVDLRTGSLVSPDDWVKPGETLDIMTFIDPKQYPDEVPFFSTSLTSMRAHPNVRDDITASLAGGGVGQRPLFDGFVSSYVTGGALVMIPDVPEVSRGQRGNVARIPWSKLRGKLSLGSVVGKLLGP